jgi:hypothetical protein
MVKSRTTKEPPKRTSKPLSEGSDNCDVSEINGYVFFCGAGVSQKIHLEVCSLPFDLQCVIQESCSILLPRCLQHYMGYMHAFPANFVVILCVHEQGYRRLCYSQDAVRCICKSRRCCR